VSEHGLTDTRGRRRRGAIERARRRDARRGRGGRVLGGGGGGEGRARETTSLKYIVRLNPIRSDRSHLSLSLSRLASGSSAFRSVARVEIVGVVPSPLHRASTHTLCLSHLAFFCVRPTDQTAIKKNRDSYTYYTCSREGKKTYDSFSRTNPLGTLWSQCFKTEKYPAVAANHKPRKKIFSKRFCEHEKSTFSTRRVRRQSRRAPCTRRALTATRVPRPPSRLSRGASPSERGRSTA
jgi:hypothetical protein